jgi:two-component system, cell cycle response regulator
MPSGRGEAVSNSTLILIVNDDPYGREVLESLLAGEGYRLAFAKSGIEAIELASMLIPDLILLDTVMQDMSGFEVCRKLRADHRHREVPIIMLTAIDDQESRCEGIEAGADDFITKPFKRVELRARIRTITRLNRYGQLLLERAQMNWMLEQASEGYLIVNEAGEILFANTRAAAYLGIREGHDRHGKETFLSIARQQYQCEPESAWTGWPERAARTQSDSHYLVRRDKQAEGPCWLKIAIYERSFGGHCNWLICLRDVTDEVLSLRNRWSFESMLSHKLRTPLSIIKTPLSTLASKGSRLSPVDLDHVAKMALQGFELLECEMKDILSYVESPELLCEGPDFQMQDLPSLIEHINNDLGLINIAVSVSENVRGTFISLTPSAVELIMWELLENAKKFHPSHCPSVEIIAEPLESTVVRLHVLDDGLTLSTFQLEQAWAPYYQCENSFTGQVSGMGLGLPSVASLVWQAGGRCSLRNREAGPGILVELDIPAREQ